MKIATNIRELAKEYVHFQNLDKDKLDFKDHLMLYDALTTKLDKAGISFYDIGLYVRSHQID